MNRFLTLIAAGLITSGAAAAQTTSQEAVLGQSGDATYSLQIRGANNVVYNCKPDVVSVDGVRARQCVKAGQGGLFENGNGLTVGAGVAAIVIVAVLAGNDSSTTTTTTN